MEKQESKTPEQSSQRREEISRSSWTRAFLVAIATILGVLASLFSSAVTKYLVGEGLEHFFKTRLEYLPIASVVLAIAVGICSAYALARLLSLSQFRREQALKKAILQKEEELFQSFDQEIDILLRERVLYARPANKHSKYTNHR